jgi:integrase
MFALTVGDFNPVTRKLSIRGRDEETTSKTGERVISLDPDALALFTRLAAGRASDAPLLSPDGVSTWNVNGDQRRFKDALLQAGAPQDAVPYSFRHTFISRRLEQGMPTAVVANHCGTSVWMIERNYAKFIPSETLRWLRATAPQARRSLQLVKTGEPQQQPDVPVLAEKVAA